MTPRGHAKPATDMPLSNPALDSTNTHQSIALDKWPEWTCLSSRPGYGALVERTAQRYLDLVRHHRAPDLTFKSIRAERRRLGLPRLESRDDAIAAMRQAQDHAHHTTYIAPAQDKRLPIDVKSRLIAGDICREAERLAVAQLRRDSPSTRARPYSRPWNLPYVDADHVSLLVALLNRSLPSFAALEERQQAGLEAQQPYEAALREVSAITSAIRKHRDSAQRKLRRVLARNRAQGSDAVANLYQAPLELLRGHTDSARGLACELLLAEKRRLGSGEGILKEAVPAIATILDELADETDELYIELHDAQVIAEQERKRYESKAPTRLESVGRLCAGA